MDGSRRRRGDDADTPWTGRFPAQERRARATARASSTGGAARGELRRGLSLIPRPSARARRRPRPRRRPRSLARRGDRSAPRPASGITRPVDGPRSGRGVDATQALPPKTSPGRLVPARSATSRARRRTSARSARSKPPNPTAAQPRPSSFCVAAAAPASVRRTTSTAAASGSSASRAATASAIAFSPARRRVDADDDRAAATPRRIRIYPDELRRGRDLGCRGRTLRRFAASP